MQLPLLARRGDEKIMAFWLVIAQITKVLAEIRAASNTLAAISSGRWVEAYIRSTLLNGALKASSAGEALDVVRLDHQLTVWAEKLIDESGDDIPNLIPTLRDLQPDMVKAVDQVRTGLRIGNPTEPSMNQVRAADPVNLARGEYEHRKVDLAINGAGLDLTFSRTYRSTALANGPFGPGWDHSLNLTLLEESEFTLHVRDGSLGSQRFSKHPRYGQAGFNYFSPPDGTHDVILRRGPSYSHFRAGLVQRRYEPSSVDGVYHLRFLRDRFGNYLRFEYEDDRLVRAYANSRDRHITLDYNGDRIDALVDHAGRRIRYHYDSLGLLSAVEGPFLAPSRGRRLEHYAYASTSAGLRLVEVRDSLGRLITENEYVDDRLSRWNGYIARQYGSAGDTTFEYDQVSDRSEGGSPQNLPTQLVLVSTNTLLQRYILSAAGQPLDIMETPRSPTDDARRRLFRYNADGQVTDRVEPDGALTQTLFARARHLGEIDWVPVPDVTMRERMAFGNLLATVRRAGRISLPTRSSRLSDYFSTFPDPRHAMAGDVRQVFTHHPRTQEQLSISDPRFTPSAQAPAETDTSVSARDYRAHLTIYQYGPSPTYPLERVCRPRPAELDARGDVKSAAGITAPERYVRDVAGKVLQKMDAEGLTTLYSYYPNSARATAGHLATRLDPAVVCYVVDELEVPIRFIARGAIVRRGHVVELAGKGIGSVVGFFEGSLLELRQAIDRRWSLRQAFGVEVWIDGSLHGRWDQRSPTYVADGLGRGEHTIRVRSDSAAPFAVSVISSWERHDFEVDDLGRVTSAIDQRGVREQFAFELDGQRSEWIRGLPAVRDRRLYTYDPDGYLKKEVDESLTETGRPDPHTTLVTSFGRDRFGRVLTQEEQALDGSVSRRLGYRYDEYGRLRWQRNPRGVETRYRYNSYGELVLVRRAPCSSDEEVTRYERDVRGRLSGEQLPGLAWKHLRYDSFGNVQVEETPDGSFNVRDHDALGNETARRVFEQLSPQLWGLKRSRKVYFDRSGRPWRERTAVFYRPIVTRDPTARPDNDFNLAVRSGRVAFSTAQTAYNARGQVVAEVTDKDGLVLRPYEYLGPRLFLCGSNGRRLYRVQRRGGEYRNIYELIVHGGCCQEVVGTTTKYDSLGREVALIDAYGDSTEYRYNSRGFLTKMRDPLENVLSQKWDAFGNLRHRSRPVHAGGLGSGAISGSIEEDFEYDVAGNLVLVTDGAMNKQKREFDLLDRLVVMRWVDPAHAVETKTYFQGGRVRTKERPDGTVLVHDYDGAGRLLSVIAKGPPSGSAYATSAPGSKWSRFEYDCVGDLVFHENEHCAVRIERDSRGLPIIERMTWRINNHVRSVSLRRRFGLNGKLIEVRYPSGTSVRSRHDVAGRVRHVSARGIRGLNRWSPIAEIDPLGERPHRVTFPAGSSLIVRRDARGQEYELEMRAPSGRSAYRLARIRDGARHCRREELIAGDRARLRRLYRYDSLGQLTEVQRIRVRRLSVQLGAPRLPVDVTYQPPDGWLSLLGLDGVATKPSSNYRYDVSQNRRWIDFPGEGRSAISVGDRNELEALDGLRVRNLGDGSVSSYGTRKYQYDPWSRLVGVEDGSRDCRIYRDALGRPSIVSHGRRVAYVIRDDAGPVAELSGSGTLREYAKVCAGVWAVRQGGEWSSIGSDDLGTPRFLISPTGLSALAPYTPFGRLRSAGRRPPGPLSFGGLEAFGWADLYLAGPRVYDAGIGRFLQADPGGNLDGLNWYKYSGNDPCSMRDPFGLQASSGEEGLPPIEQVVVNSIPGSALSLATDPVFLILGLTGPGAAANALEDRTQLHDLLRPLPYKPSHRRVGEAFEEALSSLYQLGDSLMSSSAKLTVARSARLSKDLAASTAKGALAERDIRVAIEAFREADFLKRAQSAVDEVHHVLTGEQAINMRTSAALIAQGPDGNLVTIVGGGARQLDPAQIAKAEELGYHWARYPGVHGEEAVLEYADRHGLTPFLLTTNQDFCGVCLVNLPNYLEGQVRSDMRTIVWPQFWSGSAPR